MAGTIAVALIPVAAVVLVRRVRLLRARGPADPVEPCPYNPGPVLWMEPSYGNFLRAIAPSLASAIVAVVSMAVLAGGSPFCAGVLFALAVAIPAWRWPMVNRTKRKGGWILEAAFAALLLLIISDWRAHPRQSGPAARRQQPQGIAGVPSHTGPDLSGVILTLPARPPEKVLPPPPVSPGQRAAQATRPIFIEFDGVYWYFQAPDERPRRDARVVPGDPVRAKIRSTNAIPIQMEAHQRLPEPTSMDRYREIVVAMRDADAVPGLIRISLLLEGDNRMEPLLLGTQVLEASRTQHGYGNRQIIEEELHFVLTPSARGRKWTGLVVRVEPERERAQAGAHVMVKGFLIQP